MTMWDYLDEVTPQLDEELTVDCQASMPFQGSKNQKIRYTDDNKPKVSTRSSTSVFFIQLQWENIPEADSDTVIDMYHNVAKANGTARSFKWTNYSEAIPRTYTVRFTGPLPGTVYPWGQHQFTNIKLLVEGRAPGQVTAGGRRAPRATAGRAKKATTTRQPHET